MRLTMALAAADDAPRIVIYDREILLAAWGERIVKVLPETSWLVPRILGIPKEHA